MQRLPRKPPTTPRRAAGRRPRRRPADGRRRLMCTRIWWVRPVSSRHSTSAARPRRTARAPAPASPPACRPRSAPPSACGRPDAGRSPPSIRSTPPGSQPMPARCRSRGLGRVGRAVHHREVAPLEVVRLELRRQPLVRGVGLGDDEQPGGVLVDPVHDARAGAARRSPTARRRQWCSSALTSVPSGAPGRRMHDEPGRLVDDDQMRRPRRRCRAGSPRARPRSARGARQAHHQLGARARAARAGRRARMPSLGRHRAVEDQRLQPRPAERQRLWHRRGQGLIKPLAGRAAQRDPKLAKRLRHGATGPLADEDFPEPPRLRRLRRLVTAADRDADRRGDSNRRPACHPPVGARPAPALPAEIALPAGESARAVTLGDGWLAVVTVDAAGRERIRVLDRATGAERAVTEIAPAD